MELLVQVNIIAVKCLKNRPQLRLGVVLRSPFGESSEDSLDLTEGNILGFVEVHVLEKLRWVEHLDLKHLNCFHKLRLVDIALAA
jgi:hypothetical protein